VAHAAVGGDVRHVQAIQAVVPQTRLGGQQDFPAGVFRQSPLAGAGLLLVTDTSSLTLTIDINVDSGTIALPTFVSIVP
jgi:hypothetical protein